MTDAHTHTRREIDRQTDRHDENITSTAHAGGNPGPRKQNPFLKDNPLHTVTAVSLQGLRAGRI